MRAFTAPLHQLREFEEMKTAVSQSRGVVAAAGCMDTQKPHMIYGFRQDSGACLIVTFNEQRARELLEAYRFFDDRAVYFPAKDILFYQSDIRGNALTRERMLAYRALMEQQKPVIVTTFDALLDRLVSPEIVEAMVLRIRTGDELDLKQMRERLVCMGYENNYQAEEPGQFAVRGGILDIFPLTEDAPYRIEFWGDEVDSIRRFSPESQRSVETLDEIEIYPASELVLSKERLKKGLSALGADAKKLYERYRKEMKTEEAHRVKENSALVREQLEELGSIRAAESYLSYFYQDTVGILDFLRYHAEKKNDGYQVFVDEPARCMEKAQVVEKEFSDSMKQRLEKGYVLPGQMDALFSQDEVVAKLRRMS